MAERASDTQRGSTTQKALNRLHSLEPTAPDTPRPVIALHMADACRRNLESTAFDAAIVSPKTSALASSVARTFPAMTLETDNVAAMDIWLDLFRSDVAEVRVKLEMALLLEAQPSGFIITAASVLEAIEQFLGTQPCKVCALPENSSNECAPYDCSGTYDPVNGSGDHRFLDWMQKGRRGF
ncbi:hypothetical protein [Arthrobacter sp. CAN_C5]|uniref:hypothetical protein n=1 Tax=Arthrobacter sp. CAN_C5 TaxID=2760706 RepID=UPI001AE8081F|nr:hypothetical protein [Arthrobacter sp. CAN_C5]MBP2215996.1 hypothetical protein [Arthrobacter sp. CAN_C5]